MRISPSLFQIIALFAVVTFIPSSITTGESIASCLAFVSVTSPREVAEGGSQATPSLWEAKADGQPILWRRHGTDESGQTTCALPFSQQHTFSLWALAMDPDAVWDDTGNNQTTEQVSCVARTIAHHLVRLRVYVPDTTTGGRINHRDWSCMEFAFTILIIAKIAVVIEGDVIELPETVRSTTTERVAHSERPQC